jgi:hypothetical protein
MPAQLSLALFVVATLGFANGGPQGVGQGAPPLGADTRSVANDGQARDSRALGMRPARVDLDFRKADLHNVFRLLAKEGRVNIVLGADVSGTVTMTLNNVLVADVFATLLRAHNLVYERIGAIILVRRASAQHR